MSRPVAALLLIAVALAALSNQPVRATQASDGREVDDPAVTEDLAWHLEEIGAPLAWRSGLGTGVVVAVIDSGVDATHPDLDHQVTQSVSCLGAEGDPERCRVESPGSGAETHGTHVAGLIAARADDGVGVAGVAPRARLLVVRALRTSCPTADDCRLIGSTDDVAAGVRWAVDAGADVINLSLTSPRLGAELESALAQAWDAGVVPVLAAGPQSDAADFFGPSAAVVVTATARGGALADHAPFLSADAPGMASPGGNEGDSPRTCRVGGAPLGLLSTAARSEGDGSGYSCLTGTSMAAAVVSGSLAVLISMGHPPEQALDRLIATSRPGSGLGAGAIDLAAATSGPHPPGVSATEDSFDTGAPPAEVSAATTGPFRAIQEDRSDPRSDRLVLVLVGLAAIIIGDLASRIWSRRRREASDHRDLLDH